LVYGALTILLGIIFGSIVYGISLITQGQYAFITFGIAAAVAGILFQPVRYRLVRYVDRRFYNIHIDYYKPAPPASSVSITDRTALLPSTHFNAYTDLKLIGYGGMSDVYRANHPTLGQPVAIKLLSPRLATDPSFYKRFEYEARLISRLHHPNIVHVYDFGEEGDTRYIVMEYIDGQSLKEYLQACGRLPLAHAKSILSAIAGALDYVHSQGLVHRDINQTSGIFRPVLMDFGIAKLVGENTQLTQTEALLGTLDYIAPEQIQATPDVDQHADVYSFGVLAFELITGQLPFRYSNPGALLMAHLREPPPEAHSLVSDIPQQISSILQRAMAKMPEERYSTAGEFVTALVQSI
jgi:serine/threonine-protein kinase